MEFLHASTNTKNSLTNFPSHLSTSSVGPIFAVNQNEPSKFKTNSNVCPLTLTSLILSLPLSRSKSEKIAKNFSISM